MYIYKGKYMISVPGASWGSSTYTECGLEDTFPTIPLTTALFKASTRENLSMVTSSVELALISASMTVPLEENHIYQYENTN